jgi:hypothetical protein
MLDDGDGRDSGEAWTTEEVTRLGLDGAAITITAQRLERGKMKLS